MSKLVLRNISRVFGDFVAVDDFSLELRHGEFVSLLGPSGCGKTTTLRMIAGFLNPSAGVIEMDGKVLSSAGSSLPPEKRRMSMIFQSYAIWPNMTVAENVAFGLKIRRMKSDEIRRKLDRILDVVQLGHLAGRYPAELSGGQQQRVALARAIVVEPEVLLLDEPLSNLDANLREEMRFEIRRLHNEFKITTVYVTHDQGEAMVTSDRVVVMNKGRVEQVDDPFTLYNYPKTRFVAGFIGRTNFLEGRRENGAVDFGGFAAKLDLLPNGIDLGSEVLFSVRPQNIVLHSTAPVAPTGEWWIEGSVCERAYLGENWEYTVAPRNSDRRLRVTAPPMAIFDVGNPVWLEVDPRHMIALPSGTPTGLPA